MKKYIIFSLLCLFIISCTKTIDFNEEEFANQLVLNSIIWPDSVFKASVSKSSSILENELNPRGPITDATMDIFENNQVLAQLSSSSGRFQLADFKPKAGNTYKVVVKSGGKQITAETVIPNRAEILSVDTITENSDYSYYKFLHFKIKIKDTPGEDYYRIILFYENLTMMRTFDINNNERRTYYHSTSQSYIEPNDPVFKSVYNSTGEEIVDIGPENRYNIFPDDLFNGKEHSIDIKTSYFSNTFNPSNPQMYGNVPLYDRFTIHVQHISKDLYNYLKYLELYDYYHDNPIAEPIPVYSNVKNGAGIFAGFNDEAKYTFEKINIPFSMDTIKIEKNPYGGGGNGGY